MTTKPLIVQLSFIELAKDFAEAYETPKRIIEKHGEDFYLRLCLQLELRILETLISASTAGFVGFDMEAQECRPRGVGDVMLSIKAMDKDGAVVCCANMSGDGLSYSENLPG